MAKYHPRPLLTLFSSALLSSPNRPFLEFGHTVYTYHDLDLRSSALAAALRERGLSSGDHLALLLPNSPEFILAWLASLKLGLVLIPINPSYLSAELKELLTHSESKLLLTTPSLSSRVPPGFPLLLTQDFPTKPASAFTPSPNLDPESLFAILYTSGTTGRPKGVMLSQRSFVVGGESFAYRAALTAQDRLLVILPLFHINAQVYSLVGSLVAQATLVLTDGFHASSFWSIVKDTKITQFNFLGVIANILLASPPSSLDQAHQVRLACGAGLSAKTHRAFTTRFGIPVLETYGLTEAPMGLSNTLTDLRPGSLGKPSRHPHPLATHSSSRLGLLA